MSAICTDEELWPFEMQRYLLLRNKTLITLNHYIPVRGLNENKIIYTKSSFPADNVHAVQHIPNGSAYVQEAARFHGALADKAVLRERTTAIAALSHNSLT